MKFASNQSQGMRRGNRLWLVSSCSLAAFRQSRANTTAPGRGPSIYLTVRTWQKRRCSCIAFFVSLLLALGSVFRKYLGEGFDFTRRLELGSTVLRNAHSGHPGDYVAWLSFGTAAIGLLLICLFR
jgi:hypothetical protein